LAATLLAGEPALRGQQQLRVFEELLIRELLHLCEVRHLHEVLLAAGFTHCRFLRPAAHARSLQRHVELTRSSLQVSAPVMLPQGRRAALARSCARLVQGGFTRDTWAKEWRQVLARLDPWQRRLRLRPMTLPSAGGLWFYTTAFTFTRSGLLYEPWLPQSLQFMVDDPNTGGVPLTSQGRAFIEPGCFGTRAMEPGRDELQSARQSLLAHLRSVALSPRDAVLRDQLLESAMMDSFLHRHLPQSLFATSLFEAIVARLQPQALVVGNPVFEAHALLAARKAGIPTLLLQHGILGDFCQYVDPPADHYLVRGSFWADFLAPVARKRAHILNPPEPVQPASREQNRGRQLLFLTTPYALQPLWDEADLGDILRVLLDVCSQQAAVLVVRVHPLEALDSYRQLIARLQTDEAKCVVQYSQGKGLDELLATSSVAVTYASTAFLDCLRHHVPIVSFDWHDFSYKQQIRDKGVFHFAASLDSLRSLVTRGLLGDLPSFSEDCTPFLASTHPEELRQRLSALIKGSAGA
jgi:hypothetical protein